MGQNTVKRNFSFASEWRQARKAEPGSKFDMCLAANMGQAPSAPVPLYSIRLIRFGRPVADIRLEHPIFKTLRF